MKKWQAIIWWCICLGLVSLACDLTSGENTAPLPTPTPTGDTLILRVPIFTQQLEIGDSVPGTQLAYIGADEEFFYVTIDGRDAPKKTGDSFNWRGIIAPGVYGNYNLRLTTTLFGKLVAGGSVELYVFNPVPVALDNIASVSTPLYFSGIAIQYTVPSGREIPGTTLSYIGETPSGAELAGTTGHPYLSMGDSLVWVGHLRENVIVRYNLRVTGIDANGLSLTGTAEMWITE